MMIPMHKIIMEHEEKSNGHWFSKGSMRFFNSRLPNYGYLKGDNVYFISSERFDHKTPRLFTVRVMDRNTGEIDTIGEFNTMTKTEARRELASILGWKIKDL